MRAAPGSKFSGRAGGFLAKRGGSRGRKHPLRGSAPEGHPSGHCDVCRLLTLEALRAELAAGSRNEDAATTAARDQGAVSVALEAQTLVRSGAKEAAPGPTRTRLHPLGDPQLRHATARIRFVLAASGLRGRAEAL
mmetsp:Transcript_124077/g.345354  ORF Transcript_124077/g.345354 Transcript_124077/m.345354 type:complete len:136 (-) Transcript_124077:589-996(-)